MGLFHGLLQVFDQILGIFKAHAEPQQGVGDAQLQPLRFRNVRMGLSHRQGDEAFRTAETFGEGDNLDVCQHLQGGFGAVQRKAQHGTAATGLLAVDIITGMLRKTLAVRMERAQENALAIAQWLKTQPKVKKVYYTGFEDHKDYAIMTKQTTGFSGMISFELDCLETAMNLLSRVKMILFAESLGGVETLVTYPMTQTHESIPADVREKLGINERFIRISIGIENVNDIIADLEQALA